jgi:hypothetical protein
MKIIEIDGIKYQLTPIEETKPETLYDLCEEWVNDTSCPSATIDKLIEKVKQWIPEEAVVTEPDGDESYITFAWNNGYNSYREELLKKLR